ncbi:MAG: hypothetical protein MK207_12360 [Saprospiraceae bacterium]|nr:hypothetical protein [Saprospiraceae bacterium]
MKKILLILLTIPLLFGSCEKDNNNTNGVVSNTWTKTYGGIGYDIGRSVQQTTDGGYIITGITLSFSNGDYDVYLIKTDDNGIEQWTKTYGGTDFDDGYSVQQTTDSGYIITGFTRSFGNGDYDVYLIKMDVNGVEQWSKTYGGTGDDIGRSVQQTTDGGYIISGSTNSFGNGGSDVYLIKTDGIGMEQWTKTYGGIGDDDGYSVQQTTDGGYIIIGYTNSFGNGDYDVYLIKMDDNGIEQWSKTYGGTGFDDGYSVQQTIDGGYIITGHTNSLGNAFEVYLIKTDGNGVKQWSKIYGGTDNDGGTSVQQTTDGGYIITGSVNTLGNGYEVYLLKTDGNGVEEWSKAFGGTGDDIGKSVQQTTDDGYIITGYTNSFVNGDYDLYLIKTDSNGDVHP